MFPNPICENPTSRLGFEKQQYNFPNGKKLPVAQTDCVANGVIRD